MVVLIADLSIAQPNGVITYVKNSKNNHGILHQKNKSWDSHMYEALHASNTLVASTPVRQRTFINVSPSSGLIIQPSSALQVLGTLAGALIQSGATLSGWKFRTENDLTPTEVYLRAQNTRRNSRY
jgi:hypothetical protein